MHIREGMHHHYCHVAGGIHILRNRIYFKKVRLKYLSYFFEYQLSKLKVCLKNWNLFSLFTFPFLFVKIIFLDLEDLLIIEL